MGLHAGMICFKGDLSHLKKVLARRGCELGPLQGGVSFDDLFDGPLCERRSNCDFTSCGWRFSFGYCAFLDRTLVLSFDPDIPVELARHTGHHAVSWTCAKGTGTYAFSAASPEGSIRAYHYCHSSMTKAWSIGTSLRCEREVAFDEQMGIEVFESALIEIGFPRHVFDLEGKWQPMEVGIQLPMIDGKTPLSAACDIFIKAHQRNEPGCLPRPIARIVELWKRVFHAGRGPGTG
jgi:hypothetical protein